MIPDSPTARSAIAAVGWTTTASREQADALAAALLEHHLVACAQVSSPIRSHYSWQGQLHTDEEYRITLKFLDIQAPAIEAFLEQHHPYDVPQWLWVRMDGIAAPYFDWMCESQ